MLPMTQYYRNYEELMLELHKLTAMGQGDTEEAQQLWSAMGEPERFLTESQIAFLNGLSGDLYMLQDKEIADADVTAKWSGQALATELAHAYRARDWSHVLRLLRGKPDFLRPDQIAYMRSRAYAELDHLSPAVIFMDEAARRAASDANYRALALDLLVQRGDFAEALARTRRYLQSAETDRRLTIVAALAVCRLVHRGDIPSEEALDLARLAREKLAGVLQSTGLSAAMRFSGFGALGVLGNLLGDQNAAIQAFTDAMCEPTEGGNRVVAYGLIAEEKRLLEAGKLGEPEEKDLTSRLTEALAPDEPLAA